MLLHGGLLLCWTAAAAALQTLPAPRDGRHAGSSAPRGGHVRVLRRDFLLRATALTVGTTATGAFGALASQLRTLLAPAPALGTEWQDPPELAAIPSLRSSAGTEAVLERKQLEREWQQLIEARDAGRLQRPEAEEAFAAVLDVRRVLGKADAAAQAQADDDWRDAIQQLITPRLVSDLERACTTLACSRGVLSSEARSNIGWPWGASGWRRAAAQADAGQALCKLRVNLGMASPREARYYLDVAKRSVDEILLLGASEGLVKREALPEREYLPAQALDEILAVDEATDTHEEAGSHKVLGSRWRADQQFDLEERLLLEEQQAAPEDEMEDEVFIVRDDAAQERGAAGDAGDATDDVEEGKAVGAAPAQPGPSGEVDERFGSRAWR